MASFFQSFRASLMPKQLLRYALLRLEVLDPEALDLENLDFALGRNSVLEFRDVGLVLEKLSILLDLPPAFCVQRARVLLLRVTIPVDFYSSPVIIEINGIDVRLKVASSQDSTSDPQSPKKRKGKRRVSEIAPDEPVDAIPSAADLAQSFLETQPMADRRELEAALASETQDLGASVAMSESESSSDDGDSSYGTGQSLSLPVFLAKFLQGILDRMQLRIREVTFHLDVEAPVHLTDTARAQTPAPAPADAELVTLQLAIQSINVEGVTAPAVDANGVPIVAHKEGKRHIWLESIRGYLITEANVFSTLSRSSSMNSSEALQESVLAAATAPGSVPQGQASPSLTMKASTSSDALDGSDDLVQSELAQSHYALQDSEDAFNIPYEMDHVGAGGDPGANGDRNAALADAMDEPSSSLSTPKASMYQEFGSAPAGHPYAQSTIMQPQPVSRSALGRQADSELHLQVQGCVSAPRTPSPQPIPSGEPGSAGYDPSKVEDLTQSHLYSHEDAESMYMSAFTSQAQSVADQVEPGTTIPGAWEADESPTAPFRSTILPDRQPSPPRLPEDATIPSSLSNPSPSSAEQPREPDTSTPEQTTSPRKLQKEISSSSPEPDAVQDPVPTPRGIARLVKEVLSLDSVSVYVPLQQNRLEGQAADMGRSVAPDLPGAFPVHQAAASSGKSQVLRPTQASSASPRPELPHQDHPIEIILQPLTVRFDASIAFILARVVGKLLEALQDRPAKQQAKIASGSSMPAQGSSKVPNIDLRAESLSLLFLEKLIGVADTPRRILEAHNEPVNFGPVTLLQAHMVGLNGKLSRSETKTMASVDLTSFRFGYVNDDIISFDGRYQMYESVVTQFPSTGRDVSIQLSMLPEETSCNVETLPLLIRMDLQKLDDTFTWFGGLSSFLNMGSSIMAQPARDSATSVQIEAAQKPPRGVRFEGPAGPDDRDQEPRVNKTKLNMRVNSLRLDVIGRECGVVLDTSALKLVCRGGDGPMCTGVHFSKIRLEGPKLRNSGAEPPILAEMTDTRVDYYMLPRHSDLEDLLELITPSEIKFDEDGDEIMVDTLLRQRRKGPLLKVKVEKVTVDAGNMQQLTYLPSLGEDLAKLGTVAKYLPEDDRPGLLTMGHIKSVDCAVAIGGRFGTIQAVMKDLMVAHISVPALVAVAMGSISVNRNTIEELVASTAVAIPEGSKPQPVLRLRMVDDIEPVLKVTMVGVSIEYRVPTVMDLLGLAEDATPQDFEAGLAESVANLGDQARTAIRGVDAHRPVSSTEQAKKPIKVGLSLRDTLVGLNPLGLASKMVVVLTDAHVDVTPERRDAIGVVATLRKASILVIDDVSMLDSDVAHASSRRHPPSTTSRQITGLCKQGYVDICQISSAKATVNVGRSEDGEQRVDVEIRDDLLVLETCADSTQTLISLANALKPPTPPSKEIKYKTQVVSVKDLLASITADAFGRAEGDYDFDNDFGFSNDELEIGDADAEDEFFFGDGGASPVEASQEHTAEGGVREELFDALASSIVSGATSVQDTNDGVLLSIVDENAATASSSGELQIDDNYLEATPAVRGTAHRWNSLKNTYDQPDEGKLRHSPVQLRVRDVHIIWNLFDGYDWVRTREVIYKAVQDVEAKAVERNRERRGGGADIPDEEPETVIGDFLFNSIYIGIPSNRDPRELAQAINQELNDNGTETESLVSGTTASTGSTVRAAGYQHHQRSRSKKLKLNRSRRHKITFELKGVNCDVIVFPPGETLSSVDVRVRDLDVFDHVPTSTWRKLAMYDYDAGEREMGASMVHIELLNVRPVPSMPASEIVVKATVLPLRLHVDQDALDFITRFFEFKDDLVPVHASPSDIPFIQRAEVNDVPVKLDFKPKRVDYKGLRSGHTTEFMNFMILEDARLTLRHVILYGVPGFDRLGNQLNDIWTADVKRSQLPGILAGLAPVRSLVNASSGFRDLVEIPIREYHKDGRIVRSIRKGAFAFAKTTGTEVVKLGAKLAIGTQYVLQNAEGMLAPGGGGGGGGGNGGEGSTSSGGVGVAGDMSHVDWDDGFPGDEDGATIIHTGAGGGGSAAGGGGGGGDDGEQQKTISLYADQPMGLVQGMRGAYASLARDLSVARDAIIAVPGEVMESQSAQGAAKAVLRRAPTIIFRPAIGATKAIGQTLLGATNALDPQNRRRVEAKYKRH